MRTEICSNYRIKPNWAVVIYFYCCVDGQIPPITIHKRVQIVKINLHMGHKTNFSRINIFKYIKGHSGITVKWEFVGKYGTHLLSAMQWGGHIKFQVLSLLSTSQFSDQEYCFVIGRSRFRSEFCALLTWLVYVSSLTTLRQIPVSKLKQGQTAYSCSPISWFRHHSTILCYIA
jgi:hypothetical protein